MANTASTILSYPEGLPDTLPESQVVQPDLSDASIQQINIVRRFNNMIPSTLVSDQRLSTTSAAKDCFVYRRNSLLMQQLMVDFAYNVVKAFNLTQEV